MINKEETQAIIIYLPKHLVKVLDTIREAMNEEAGMKVSRSEFIKMQLDIAVMNILSDIKKGQSDNDKHNNDNGKIN